MTAEDDVQYRLPSSDYAQSYGPDHDIIALSMHEPRRTTSMPSSAPLRSASANSSLNGGNVHSDPTTPTRRKRARFDESQTSDCAMRRVSTEPVLFPSDSMQMAVPTYLDRQYIPLYQSESDDADDEEGGGALAAFDTVMEELVQVAEEYDEAREERAEVTHEVAEALAESCEQDSEEFPRGSQSIQDFAAELAEYLRSRESSRGSIRAVLPSIDPGHRIGTIKQSAADDEIDETCMKAEGIASADLELTQDVREQISPMSECECQELASEVPVERLPVQEALRREFMNSRQSTSTSSGSTGSVIGPWSRSNMDASKPRISEPQMFPDYVTPTASDSPLVRHGSPSPRANAECVPTAMRSTLNVTRRRVSMSELNTSTALRGLLLPPKAAPAGCAVTACSVRIAEPPRIDTVYEHPELLTPPGFSIIEKNSRVQTVRSDAGIFQVVWNEPLSRRSGGTETPISEATIPTSWRPMHEIENASNSSAIPMEKVGTKLAAWSWARENSLLDKDGKPKWIPLLPLEDDILPKAIRTHEDEGPLTAPNTQMPSVASSAKHSAPCSPPFRDEIEEEDDGDREDEDERPIELRVKPTCAHPPKLKEREFQIDYVDYPMGQTHSLPSTPGSAHPILPIPRQLSNLTAEDARFTAHRDSVILLRKKEREEGLRGVNQQLMNSEDSIILTRSKMHARFPRRPNTSDASSSWNRHRGLSTIPDASPPHSASMFPQDGAHSVRVDRCADNEESPRIHEAHPEEDVNCPVCEVERPRWFEANCKKGVFM